MSNSHTTTTSGTFTLTQAKYLASKVITDLQRCSQIYGHPSESRLSSFRDELTMLLKEGYVKEYEFGFEENGHRIVSWKYRVQFGDLVGGNERPGSIFRKAEIDNATHYNFLSYSEKWFQLAETDRQNFQSTLPINRTTGNLPMDGNGYWKSDKSYSATGCLVSRTTFVPH